MNAFSPALTGHKGLRGETLLEIKKRQPVTAKELADVFDVSANAIRRHLKELEAESLVSYGREQRGTGAPTYAYRLTSRGEALFPNQYEQALTRLIGHVVDKEGREAAVAVVEGEYTELRGRIGSNLSGKTPQHRLRAVADVLQGAGFMAELSEVNGETVLAVNNCALHAVASCLPEVCETEISFLEDVLNARVERRTHILDGCNSCLYSIDFGEEVKSPLQPTDK